MAGLPPHVGACSGLAPLMLAVALVVAPWAHEAAHDHCSDRHVAHSTVETACNGLHHHHHHVPATPAIPANDTPEAPANNDPAPERDDCWVCHLLYAPAVPAVPPIIVSLAEAIPPTNATVPTRRIPLGVFNHSFGTRGPPIA